MKCKILPIVLIVLTIFSIDSMRRSNAIQLKVKAPSSGLVTRYPSESADQLRGDRDASKVCSVASNVRFENGVMANAPGYENVTVSSTILSGLLAHWRFEEVTGTRYDSTPNGFDLSLIFGSQSPATAGKIGNALFFNLTAQASTYENTSATLNAVGSTDFTFCFWVKITQGSSVGALNVPILCPAFEIQFAPSGGNTVATVSLANSDGSTAVSSAFSNNAWHFIAVQYNTTALTISVSVDNGAAVSTAWINPVNSMYSFSQYFQLNHAVSLSHPNFNLYVAFDSMSIWTRVLTAGELTRLYNSANGNDFPFINGRPRLLYQANLNTTPTNPLLLATDASLYSVARSFTTSPRAFTATLTDLFDGTVSTSGYYWSAADFYDKVLFAQHDNVPQYWINAATVTRDLPGLNVNTNEYSATSDGSEKYDGITTSSFGHAMLWRNNIIKWSDLNDFTNYIPVESTVASLTLTVANNFTQPAVGSTVTVSTTEDPLLTVGQFVRIDDTQSGLAYYNFYSVTARTVGPNTVTLKLLGTTGRTASASTIASGKLIETLDANEAGENQTIGSLVNGPIFQATSMGEYTYVFKEWSVSSMQYVGAGNGVFFSRTEVTREGAIGRNAVRNLGNGSIVFLGHRDLYSYQGGPNPTPICRQFTRQLYSELDRTRLDEVAIHHNEQKNEVWVMYPVVGGQKVLIWNYIEDSATVDDYDQSFSHILAARQVSWEVDPTWGGEPATLLWTGFDQLQNWSSLVDLGNVETNLLASGSGDLLVQGFVFNRAGAAYTAIAETMDYDFGDRAVFKYIDVIHLGLQVAQTDNTTRNLYVQVGTRSALDQDITWSTAKAIAVQGNANTIAKVNPGASGGRYVRLRFYSEDADVQWRISSYEIYGRAGGTC